jgi:hypothetical protein
MWWTRVQPEVLFLGHFGITPSIISPVLQDSIYFSTTDILEVQSKTKKIIRKKNMYIKL